MLSEKSLAIAIAADAAYSEQVVTLIKSICYHHRNVHIYLFNKNFPSQLGRILSKHLEEFDSQITSVQVDADFSNLNMPSHINEVGCYRFFIPDIKEERILYLDADIIVDGNLDSFFRTDFEDNYVVAIPDMVINHSEIIHCYAEFPDLKPYFNSGVLLINNKAWREQDIKDKSLWMCQTYPGLIYPDQDILNILCHGKWKQSSIHYNFQTGARFGLYERQMYHQSDEQELACQEPIIIHYTGRNKAWLNHNPILYAERYWFYYNLTWQEIKKK